jgi:hypothetical protein
MKTRAQMTKVERIADTVRSGTRTSRILDKIRKERKNDVCVTFAPEGAKPLTDREHTLDAVVRRELEQVRRIPPLNCIRPTVGPAKPAPLPS